MTQGFVFFLLLFHASAVSRKLDTSLSPFSLISDVRLTSPVPSLLPLLSSDWGSVENELKQHAHAVTQQNPSLDSLPSFQSLVSQLPSSSSSFSSPPMFSELSSSLRIRDPDESLQPINSLVSVTSQLPSLSQIQRIQADIQNVDQQRALLQGYSSVAEQAMQSATMMASVLRDNVTQAVAQVLSNKDKLLNWIEQQKQAVVTQLNDEERHMTQLTSQARTVTQAVQEANQKLLGYRKLQDQLVTERQLQTSSPSNPSVERAMLPLPQFQQTLTQLMSFQNAASQVVDQGTEALQQLSVAYQTSAHWYISTRATLKAWLDGCQQAVTNELLQAKEIVGQAREQWSQYSVVYNQAHTLRDRYQAILAQLVAKREALQNERGSLVTSEVEKTDVKRQQLMAQIGQLSQQLQQSDSVLVALRQTAAAASAVPLGTVPPVQNPAMSSFVPTLTPAQQPNNLPRLAELLQPNRLPRLDVQQRTGSASQVSFQQSSLQPMSPPPILNVVPTSPPETPSASTDPSTLATNPIQSPIDATMLANLQDTIQPFRTA